MTSVPPQIADNEGHIFPLNRMKIVFAGSEVTRFTASEGIASPNTGEAGTSHSRPGQPIHDARSDLPNALATASDCASFHSQLNSAEAQDNHAA